MRLAGFKSIDDGYGKTSFDLRCKAAEYAEWFCQQDSLAFQKQLLRSIDVNYYSDGNIHFFITDKTPIRDNQNKVIGLSGSAAEIKQAQLLKWLQAFTQSNNHLQKKSSEPQSLSISFSFENLTRRQSECLFYLIRGKSAKSIANILSISPRTVESHIQATKEKLKCYNKQELIETTLNSGGLNFIPQSLLNKPISVIV